MIIKTLRWHTADFNRLVQYAGREKERKEGFSLLHNLRYCEDLEEIANQLKMNDAFRKKRARGVSMYHEILSFHKADREHLTPEVLEDLTRKYLSLRAPDGLAFASSHHDRDHVHVHIVLSGTLLRSSKTLRMDNPTFTRVRRQIEAYQLERYPELSKSVVHLTKKVRSEEILQEMEAERPMIEQAYEEAQSMPDFLDRVADLGVDASKYQLLESGQLDFQIDTSRLEELDRRMDQLAALQKAKSEREKDIGDEFERERSE